MWYPSKLRVTRKTASFPSSCLLWMNKVKGKDKIYMGCRCYGRLQPNTKEFTRLSYTELVLERKAAAFASSSLVGWTLYIWNRYTASHLSDNDTFHVRPSRSVANCRCIPRFKHLGLRRNCHHSQKTSSWQAWKQEQDTSVKLKTRGHVRRSTRP
jgi:hypothetical protein